MTPMSGILPCNFELKHAVEMICFIVKYRLFKLKIKLSLLRYFVLLFLIDAILILSNVAFLTINAYFKQNGFLSYPRSMDQAL